MITSPTIPQVTAPLRSCGLDWLPTYITILIRHVDPTKKKIGLYGSLLTLYIISRGIGLFYLTNSMAPSAKLSGSIIIFSFYFFLLSPFFYPGIIIVFVDCLGFPTFLCFNRMDSGIQFCTSWERS